MWAVRQWKTPFKIYVLVTFFLKISSKQVKTVSVTFCVLWFWSRSAPTPSQGPTSAGAAGPPPATSVSSNKRLQQTQAQVDEVSRSR